MTHFSPDLGGFWGKVDTLGQFGRAEPCVLHDLAQIPWIGLIYGEVGSHLAHSPHV